MTQPRLITPFTSMFGIDYPVVCAPMFLVSNVDLVAAACQAGVMAAFPAVNYRTHEEFANAVREIKARTDKPFGVNLVLKWNDRLAADMELVLKEQVALIITSLGDPTGIIQATRGTPTRVFSDVINQRHATKVCQAGVDGLVAVAYGAGGHAGQISPFVLGPWLKKEFGLPVLAAGGIADGRGLAAALALGLDAAYMGTRFIATREAPAMEDYKQAIVESQPEDIEYTDRVSGILGNYIRKTLPQDLQAGARAEGRWTQIWSAGQGVGLIDDVPSVKELVDRIVEEYEAARTSLPALRP
ncbi:MAG: nitronate monooxygenase [Planctomycetota bacterium]